MDIMQKLVDENCSADPRRRSKNLRSLKSTSELNRRLKDHGIILSQSSAYRRYIPVNKSSNYSKTYHTLRIKINLFFT